MGYSYLVTQPSTNPAQQGLTLLSGQNMFLSLWYSNSTLNAYAKFLRWEKVSKREKKSLILYGWESREQKTLEEYENENYYLLWWSDKRHFPYNCLGLSEEKKTYQKEKKISHTAWLGK